VRLDVALVLHRRVVGVLQHQVSLAEPQLDIALALEHVGAQVGHVGQVAVGAVIGRVIRVQDGRARLHCRTWVEDRGQLVVLDVDQGQRFLGRIAVVGRHRHDRIAHVAHAIVGQDGDVRDAAPVAPAAEVMPRQDGVDAPQAAAARRVDADDARVRQGAAQDRAPERPKQAHVGTVPRLAGDLVAALDATNRAANDRLHHLAPSP
jgi:hypothetical protein